MYELDFVKCVLTNVTSKSGNVFKVLEFQINGKTICSQFVDDKIKLILELKGVEISDDEILKG